MRSQTADNILKTIKNRKPPYILKLLDTEITVSHNVYPPREESIFLAEQLANQDYGIKKGNSVLDYGCGTGFLSIISAKLGARVIAIDINEQAIKNTLLNINNNSVNQNVIVRQGKSFNPIFPNEKFDLILANLPFEEAEIDEIIEYSVYDLNFQMRKDLFENAKKHLTKNGRILFSYSERAQGIKPIQESSEDYIYKIIAKRLIDYEPYIIFLIKPKEGH